MLNALRRIFIELPPPQARSHCWLVVPKLQSQTCISTPTVGSVDRRHAHLAVVVSPEMQLAAVGRGAGDAALLPLLTLGIAAGVLDEHDERLHRLGQRVEASNKEPVYPEGVPSRPASGPLLQLA
jgi:hypothetical protein